MASASSWPGVLRSLARACWQGLSCANCQPIIPPSSCLSLTVAQLLFTARQGLDTFALFKYRDSQIERIWLPRRGDSWLPDVYNLDQWNSMAPSKFHLENKWYSSHPAVGSSKAVLILQPTQRNTTYNCWTIDHLGHQRAVKAFRLAIGMILKACTRVSIGHASVASLDTIFRSWNFHLHLLRVSSFTALQSILGLFNILRFLLNVMRHWH